MPLCPYEILIDSVLQRLRYRDFNGDQWKMIFKLITLTVCPHTLKRMLILALSLSQKLAFLDPKPVHETE